MSKYEIPELPLKFDLENKAILKQASLAHRQLAELKGVAHTIPHENILISTLTLQEAKDSSEVESIVTTQDDLYRYEIKAENFEKSPASKEVLKYREAIRTGFEKLRKGLPLTSNLIQEVQSVLIGNTAGFRKVPGTELRDNFGNVIYQPPQDGNDVVRCMRNLEEFINRPEMADWDPLVKLAVIHIRGTQNRKGFAVIHGFQRVGAGFVLLRCAAETLTNILFPHRHGEQPLSGGKHRRFVHHNAPADINFFAPLQFIRIRIFTDRCIDFLAGHHIPDKP
jgi:Fic family protein